MPKRKGATNYYGVRKEIPANTEFLGAMLEKFSNKQPENEIQSLMESIPGHAPLETKQDSEKLRELVVDCIDALNEKQILVINAIVFEQITFQELAKRMGYKSKETARRHFAQAMDDLKIVMFSNKELMERFKDE